MTGHYYLRLNWYLSPCSTHPDWIGALGKFSLRETSGSRTSTTPDLPPRRTLIPSTRAGRRSFLGSATGALVSLDPSRRGTDTSGSGPCGLGTTRVTRLTHRRYRSTPTHRTKQWVAALLRCGVCCRSVCPFLRGPRKVLAQGSPAPDGRLCGPGVGRGRTCNWSLGPCESPVLQFWVWLFAHFRTCSRREAVGSAAPVTVLSFGPLVPASCPGRCRGFRFPRPSTEDQMGFLCLKSHRVDRT